MKAIVFTNDQAGALAMQAKLDAAYNYPVDGFDVGGGVHAPKVQSQTVHFQQVLQHPTIKTNFAAIVDGVDTSKLSVTDKTAVLSATDLTADWFPTPIVV